MIRDFSNAKKEELYRNLDVIDNKEWRPFMIWCGGRAGEFGVWADKLGISSYTKQIDNYQNRVLNTNDSTRNQIDVIFENVTETDRRYAEIFCGHAETVKEQMARVQVMTEVMEVVNSSGGNDSDDNGITYTIGEIIQQLLKSVTSESDFMDFLNGKTSNNDYDACIEELDKMYSEGHLSDRKYQYFKNMIKMISSGHIPGTVIEEIRIQMKREYENVLQENQTLDTYITEDVLKTLGWDIDQARENLGEDFIQRLKINMMKAGITNEDSIKLFLVTISHESGNGAAMLENGDEDYFEQMSLYTINTRGAGLIQVTGSSQYDLLDYLINHASDETEIENLEMLRDGYTYLDGKCDNLVTVDNMSAAEYIAANYSIESAVWYWSYYEGRITIQEEPVSINQCIEYYDGEKDNLKNFFIATQCTVNGSEFGPSGLGKLFNPENTVIIKEDTVTLKYFEDEEEKSADSPLPNGWDQRQSLYEIISEF